MTLKRYYNDLSPEEKKKLQMMKRKDRVMKEMMFSFPELSLEEAEKIWNKTCES